MRTNASGRPTLRLVGGGQGESGSASTISGLPSQGGTTWHRTQSQALSESLNSWESEIDDLESRFYEACVTLNIVMARLVGLGLTGIKFDLTTTDVVE